MRNTKLVAALSLFTMTTLIIDQHDRGAFAAAPLATADTLADPTGDPTTTIDPTTIDPTTTVDSIDLEDAWDLDPYNNNTVEDQAYLEYYADDGEEQDAEFLACDPEDPTTDPDDVMCADLPPVPTVKDKGISFKSYCRVRPGVHSMIVQLEKTKDMSWFKFVNGVAWVAGKITALFGINSDYALDIATYLSGKKDAIKTVDDLILELKQWESAMGKDVCNPLHPENKDDPDKGTRLVGQWSACKLLAPLDHNFTPKYCNMGGLDKDGAKDLAKDCDTSCRAQGGINSSNGITLEQCKTSCYQTMKAICQIAFSPEKGKAAEQKSRWGRVKNFCDGLTPDTFAK